MTAGTLWGHLLRSTPRAVGVAACGIASLDERLSTHSKASCEKPAEHGETTSTIEAKESTSGNPTLLVGLVGRPFHKEDFLKIWRKHEGPKHQLQSTQVQEKPFPHVYNLELQERLQSFLQQPLKKDEPNQHWQAEVSTGGTLGQSGAIPKERAAVLTLQNANRETPPPTESLLLFRGHAAVENESSLSDTFLDLCDEAEELKEDHALEKKSKKLKPKKPWWYRYSIGSFDALLLYWKLHRTTTISPFEQMVENPEQDTTTGQQTRNVSWMEVGTEEEVEQIANSLTKKKQVLSLNDVLVSCVSAAVARQLQEHQMASEMDRNKGSLRIPTTLNVMIPVHPETGKDVVAGDHRIGALFAPVPSDITSTAAQRLEQVHNSLHRVQETPIVFWSRLGARVLSIVLPASWVRNVMQQTQPEAAFLVTFSPGPTHRIHLEGREVEILQAFTPLPDGVPIGIVVSTYAGKVSLSVTAEPWAVPDAEKFLSWVLEEYKFLYTESPAALQTN